jgi:thiamine biosynthesis lipoprotein
VRGSPPDRDRPDLHPLRLDAARHTVELSISPVSIDLGGIGKGYAADRMAALLRDWDIERALIHGGHSSVLALGAPPGAPGWPVALRLPGDREVELPRYRLRHGALGGSGLEKGRHIVDPRSGRPVVDRRAAWAQAPDAATADALSTAFMVMTPAAIERYCARHPETFALIVTAGGERWGRRGGACRLRMEESGTGTGTGSGSGSGTCTDSCNKRLD